MEVARGWFATFLFRASIIEGRPDRENGRLRSSLSVHNKRRQINAFGLESNQHYSDNSPPANTRSTLLEADIINSPLTIPLRPVPHDSHPLTSSSTLAPLLAAFTPLDTSLVLNSTAG